MTEVKEKVEFTKPEQEFLERCFETVFINESGILNADKATKDKMFKKLYDGYFDRDDPREVKRVLWDAHDKYFEFNPNEHKMLYSILEKNNTPYIPPKEPEPPVKPIPEFYRMLKEIDPDFEIPIPKPITIEKKEPKDETPRADVTETVMFNNFDETYKEKQKQEIFDKALNDKSIFDLNEIDIQKLDTNSIEKLKGLAEYLELEFEANIPKDDIITLIKDLLNKEENIGDELEKLKGFIPNLNVLRLEDNDDWKLFGILQHLGIKAEIGTQKDELVKLIKENLR